MRTHSLLIHCSPPWPRTYQENNKLRRLVEQHGNEWGVIAAAMEGRDSKACSHRYSVNLPAGQLCASRTQHVTRQHTVCMRRGKGLVAKQTCRENTLACSTKSKYKQELQSMITTLIRQDPRHPYCIHAHIQVAAVPGPQDKQGPPLRVGEGSGCAGM